MTDLTFTYRVRQGQLLPHDGTVYEPGQTVTLTRRVAAEVRHVVEQVNEHGEIVPPPTELQLEIERHEDHEREGILRRHRAAQAGHLQDLQEIAQRGAAAATAAQAEVDRVTAAIAAIDAQLAAPQAAALAETPAETKPAERPEKPTAAPKTKAPAIPAEKE